MLLLSSCFGWGEESVDETGLVELSFTGFTIKLPNSWNEVSEGELPVPKTGNLELAYASSQERQGYINNIIILSSKNSLGEDDSALMKNNENFLKSSLKTFSLLEEKSLEFADGVTWTLLSFRGRYNTDTPETTYIQTARACGDMAYFMTLSLAEVLESYERYEYLLQSFECE